MKKSICAFMAIMTAMILTACNSGSKALARTLDNTITNLVYSVSNLDMVDRATIQNVKDLTQNLNAQTTATSFFVSAISEEVAITDENTSDGTKTTANENLTAEYKNDCPECQKSICSDGECEKIVCKDGECKKIVCKDGTCTETNINASTDANCKNGECEKIVCKDGECKKIVCKDGTCTETSCKNGECKTEVTPDHNDDIKVNYLSEEPCTNGSCASANENCGDCSNGACCENGTKCLKRICDSNGCHIVSQNTNGAVEDTRAQEKQVPQTNSAISDNKTAQASTDNNQSRTSLNINNQQNEGVKIIDKNQLQNNPITPQTPEPNVVNGENISNTRPNVVGITNNPNNTQIDVQANQIYSSLESASARIEELINELIGVRSAIMLYISDLYNGDITLSENDIKAVNSYSNIIKESTAFLRSNRGSVLNHLTEATNFLSDGNNASLANSHIIRATETLNTRCAKLESAIIATLNITNIIKNNLQGANNAESPNTNPTAIVNATAQNKTASAEGLFAGSGMFGNGSPNYSMNNPYNLGVNGQNYPYGFYYNRAGVNENFNNAPIENSNFGNGVNGFGYAPNMGMMPNGFAGANFGGGMDNFNGSGNGFGAGMANGFGGSYGAGMGYYGYPNQNFYGGGYGFQPFGAMNNQNYGAGFGGFNGFGAMPYGGYGLGGSFENGAGLGNGNFGAENGTNVINEGNGIMGAGEINPGNATLMPNVLTGLVSSDYQEHLSDVYTPKQEQTAPCASTFEGLGVFRVNDNLQQAETSNTNNNEDSNSSYGITTRRYIEESRNKRKNKVAQTNSPSLKAETPLNPHEKAVKTPY